MAIKNKRRLVRSICYWVGCDMDTAEQMLEGNVLWNGDKYIACFDDELDRLLIFCNNELIHQLNLM